MPWFLPQPQPQGNISCVSFIVSRPVSLSVPGFGWLVREARLGASLVPLFFYQILGSESKEEHMGFSDLDSTYISCALNDLWNHLQTLISF